MGIEHPPFTKVFFPVEPSFIVDFPASHVWLPEGTAHKMVAPEISRSHCRFSVVHCLMRCYSALYVHQSSLGEEKRPQGDLGPGGSAKTLKETLAVLPSKLAPCAANAGAIFYQWACHGEDEDCQRRCGSTGRQRVLPLAALAWSLLKHVWDVPTSSPKISEAATCFTLSQPSGLSKETK